MNFAENLDLKQIAETLKQIHDSFIKAGFSEMQALELTKTFFASGLKK